MKRCLAILLLLLPLVVSAEEKRTITIVFTSDIHGVIMPGRDAQSSSHQGALTRVATIIEEFRREDPELVLIDNGDTIQGNPLMYYAARQMLAERINPIIAVMNKLNYDAMAIGNHEFNFGRKYLERIMGQASFPILSANILNKSSGEPEYSPYTIIERKGLRIGILGLVTDSIPKWELPSHIENLEFVKAEAIAARYVPVLREKEGCDLVIVALHDGLLPDPDAYDGRPEGSGIVISRMKGVDALLTGHVHRMVEPLKINNTFGATCPPYGRGVVKLELEISKSEDGKQKITYTGELVEATENTPVDASLAELVKEDYDATDTYLDTTLAQLDREILEPSTRHVDSPMVDLLHRAQLEASGADISLAGLLPWQGYSMEPGPVTIRDIFRFYPYENMLVTIEIDGKQLREALEWSARYFDGVEVTEPGITLIMDKDISPYNTDNAAGVSYWIDPAAEEGHRVKQLMFEGEPVQEEQIFTVALNSYRRAGGGGYKMFKDARTVGQLDKGVREVLIDYIKKHGMKYAIANNNWYLAPGIKAFEKR